MHTVINETLNFSMCFAPGSTAKFHQLGEWFGMSMTTLSSTSWQYSFELWSAASQPSRPNLDTRKARHGPACSY
jgi:hypothetical protein